MNAAVPPPVPNPKKGLSCLALGGIGCLVLVAAVFLGGGALVARFLPQLKQFAEEAEKDPARAAAMLALKVNPDIEVQSTDDEKRTVRFKVKSSGEIMTASFEELSKGKLTVINGKGEEISIDASKAKESGIVMKGPEGQAVIGAGAGSGAPGWVPGYPGAEVQAGGLRVEKPDGTALGMMVAKTADPIEKVRAYLEAELKEAGYEVTWTLSEDGLVGNLGATKEADQSRMGVVVTRESDGSTQIVTNYQREAAPKP